VALELSLAGADVLLVNRGADRGEYASRLLSLPWRPLAGFDPGGFDLVVNATPVASEPVFDVDGLGEYAAVAELVYRTGSDTALVAAARARGRIAVDGRRVLLAEISRQFELIAGRSLPPEAARVALGGADPGRLEYAHA
jgi:3-dehydroquinate dehydratase/shikimate dehydrogenase